MRLKNFQICLGFVAAAVIAYFNSWHVPFFSDDIANITSRAQLLGQGGPLDVVAHICPDRPLQALLFWINFKISGTDPVAYRFCGAVILGILGFFVFRLFSLFAEIHLERRYTAQGALVALLYMLSPAHNQAVILISQRGVLLSTLFSVLCLYSFLRYAASPPHETEDKKLRQILLSYLWFFLGLLSKATTIAVLPIVLAYVLIYRRSLLRKASIFAPFFSASCSSILRTSS